VPATELGVTDGFGLTGGAVLIGVAVGGGAEAEWMVPAVGPQAASATVRAPTPLIHLRRVVVTLMDSELNRTGSLHRAPWSGTRYVGRARGTQMLGPCEGSGAWTMNRSGYDASIDWMRLLSSLILNGLARVWTLP